MKEHRAELYDDRLNFLEMSDPKTISYLNVETEPVDLPV